MSKLVQKNLADYFSKKPVVAAPVGNYTPPSKKQKTTQASADENTPSTPNRGAQSPSHIPSPAVPSSHLTPEQKAKIDANKIAALQKLRGVSAISLEQSTMGSSWYQLLKSEFDKPYFKKLLHFLETEKASKKTIYPPENEIYSWSRLCEVDKVKIVIVGQDPYHGPNQAHGLCFSVKRGISSPPSLQNIYKELVNDIPGFRIPSHGDLTSWAKQGVLLLNAALTVRSHEANSHAGKGWEQFTDAVIQELTKKRSELVFILWGGYAQKKCASIDGKKNFVLKGVHPSPLSASRGFFGCKHFSKANAYLEEHQKTPIDWCSVNKSSLE